MEQNEIGFHNPMNASMTLFVRDPRISWVDTSESFLILLILNEVNLYSVCRKRWLPLLYRQPACLQLGLLPWHGSEGTTICAIQGAFA
jgi:hypothetical protein